MVSVAAPVPHPDPESQKLLLADRPSAAEQGELLRAFHEPWPVGYRAWCGSARVWCKGLGMVAWKPEVWHAEYEAAVGRGEDIYFLKSRDRHATTERMLFHLYCTMMIPYQAGVYLTYKEDEAYGPPESFQGRMAATYRDLPEWQRNACPVVKGTVSDVTGFGRQGEVEIRQDWWNDGKSSSTLEMATATANVGSTRAYTQATMDELARYEDPDGTFEALMASIKRPPEGHYMALGTLTSTTARSNRLVVDWEAARDGLLPDCAALGAFWGTAEGETEEEYERLRKRYAVRGPAGLHELHRQFPRNAEEALSERTGGLLSQEALARCYRPQATLDVPEGFARWNRLE